MFGLSGIARPRRRVELLDHLECLKLNRLHLDRFTVAGVSHGSPVARLALERVVGVRGAPIVADERRSGSGLPVYLANDGRPLPFAEVIRSAIAADGVLLLAQHVGLLVRDGEVRSIEIYRPALFHFRYITSYVELLHQFGLPDAAHTRHGEDGPAQHTLVYARIQKQIVWRCDERSLSVARLGDIDERPQPKPPRGRRRPTVSRERLHLDPGGLFATA